MPATAAESSQGLWLRFLTHYRKLDIAHDLAEDIGTPRWWRGMGVLATAIACALTLAPGHARFEAAMAMPLDATATNEWRSQTLRPMALGAEKGQRMAPTRAVTPIAAVPERPSISLVATLAQGDSLGRMLERAGVGAADGAQALSLIASTMPPEEIAPGTRFDITLGKASAPGQPRPLDKLDFRARMDLDLAVSRGAGGLALGSHAIAVDTTPLRIRGPVGPGLYHAARAAGAPMKAIEQFLHAIDAHFSLDEVAPGDTFDMIVGYKRSARGETEVGDLLYAGIEHDGKPRTQLLRWSGAHDSGDAQFFDAQAMTEQRTSNALIMPVAGARITSSFGMRYHPILGFSRMHSGTDLAVPWGSPIYAVADALVTYAGWRGGYGNYVKLEHGGALATGYGHMSRFVVSPGMRVRAGQVIGYVGSTGMSTGAHLHYEVFRDGASVDPMSMHFTVRAGVDKAEMDAFRAKLARILTVKPGAALQRFSGK
ncbi:M23 family metallopeptidase [Novosphingobium rosa]|uniref:M23 family metallopeptidase n=1 Tax=Novosphingobium rosa TaxID=76978 RepID=UPI0008295755|nr:M23 family metallopeptidase [Novosphingobium rosa]